MWMNDKYDLAYVHITKCGGTAIRKVLMNAFGGISRGHVETLQHYGVMGHFQPRLASWQSTNIPFAYMWNAHESFMRTQLFSVVRNPYSRLVSAWADMKRKSYDSSNTLTADIRKHFNLRRCTFEAFVIASLVKGVFYNYHWQPQSVFLCRPNTTMIIPQCVFKLENLLECQRYLEDRTGTFVTIPQLHTSNHEEWQSYYTPYLADIVYEYYRQDFNLFGYERDYAKNQDKS